MKINDLKYTNVHELLYQTLTQMFDSDAKENCTKLLLCLKDPAMSNDFDKMA